MPKPLSAEMIVETLINGRQSERMAAQLELERGTEAINRDLVRRLILEALEGRCAPLPEDRREDDANAGARCWLLGSLAYVPKSESEPEQTLRQFVELDRDWSWWARYWALEAFYLRKPTDLEKVCRSLIQKEPDVLPRSLASAILAEKGDKERIREIKDILKDASDTSDSDSARWGVLRALRFVYLPFAVESVCRLVNDAAHRNIFSDTTFDAIVALGSVQAGMREKNQAANALANIIIHAREFQYWDVMRIRAIEALAKLRVPHTASLLLDEITDLNPAVVKAAALALESVLGADVTTARILERIRKDEETEAKLPLYADALRFLEDSETAVNRLEAAMVTGALESRDHARRLLSEMGGSYAIDKLSARAKGAERFLDVLDRADERLREMFEETLQEGQRGFRIVVRMDVTLFIAGLVLLCIAVVTGISDKNLVSVLTGSGGILSVLHGRFFAKPRQQVEASVTHLSTLKTIFLGYLRQLHQIDQAYARMMLEDEAPEPEKISQFTGLVERVMDAALKQLGSHKAVKKSNSHTVDEGNDDISNATQNNDHSP